MAEDLKNYQVKCDLPPNVGQYDHLFAPLHRGPPREQVIAGLRTGAPHPDDLPKKPERRGSHMLTLTARHRSALAEIERLKGVERELSAKIQRLDADLRSRTLFDLEA